jgi:hypothetical protein
LWFSSTWLQHSSLQKNSWFQPVIRHFKDYFGMWTWSWLRVCIVWAIKLGKNGYVYGGFGHENLSTRIEEGKGCLPAEDGSRGGSFCRGGRPAWAHRPGWPRAPPWLGFLPAWSFLLPDFLARVLHELHRPNTLIHSCSCIIGPSTWCFMLWVMSMPPCATSFTCHHEFPTKLCLLPTHACHLHVILMKVDERASNGACMINFN